METTVTSPQTPNVDQYVAAVAAISASVDGKLMGGGLPRLVGERGQRFRSVPWTTWRGRGYRRGRVRGCYKNAFELASRHSELTYVEGLACAGLSFAVHHAWCVTDDGRVVEPTWRERPGAPVESWEYLGIPFTTMGAFEVLASKMKDGEGTYGLLDARVVYDDFDPDWVEKVVVK